MVNFLKFLGIIVLLAVSFIMIAGLFVSKEYHFEKNIIIYAPKTEVWKNVSLFSNIEKWNSFKVKDPYLKSDIKGKDGHPGTVYSWNGNKKVGKGRQTIQSLQPPDSITIQLTIEKPVHSKADISFILTDLNSATKVTWKIKGAYTYPLNAVAYLFLDMNYEINKDFSTGLVNLKKICESNTTLTTLNFAPSTKHLLQSR